MLQKWEAMEASKTNGVHKQAIAGAASKKRKRIAAKAHDEGEELDRIVELNDETVDAELEEQLQEELIGTRAKKGRKGMV